MKLFPRGRALSRARRRLAVLALAVLLQGHGVGCSRPKATYPEVIPRNGIVTVDLSGIGAGRGRFHAYRSGSGKKVDFFVYRDSAGEPHAVLDACSTCYRWKKGYVLDRDEIVCLKCDMRFTMDGLAHGTGSCVPIALKAAPRGGALEIPVGELEAGSRFF